MMISVRELRENTCDNIVVAYNEMYPLDNICKVRYKWDTIDNKIKYWDESLGARSILLSYKEMVDNANMILTKMVNDKLNSIIKESSVNNIVGKQYVIDFGPDRRFSFGYNICPTEPQPFKVYGAELISIKEKDEPWRITGWRKIEKCTDNASNIESIISNMVKEFVNTLSKVFLK